MIRIASIIISIIYFSCAIVYLLVGQPFPFAWYIPVECFAYIQLPTAVILIIHTIFYKVIKKDSIWLHIKSDFKFFIVSILALITFFLAMIMKEIVFPWIYSLL
jgi:hypothetical protein